jgi:hypothetical protein
MAAGLKTKTGQKCKRKEIKGERVLSGLWLLGLSWN